MKQSLLQIGVFPPNVQTMVDAQFRCYLPSDLESRPQLRPDIRGIVTRSNYRVPEDLVRSLPNLGIIATCGVGYDRIPVTAARDLGIHVTNTPDVLNGAVAELTVGLILSLLRRLPFADQYVRADRWPEGALPLGESLEGKRVGIVGLGRIGKSIARRLAAFDVSLAYYGRTRQPLEMRYEPDLVALASGSDILVLAAPGSAETHHLIDRKVLGALGANGFLVNIARGSLVNEDDLAEALENHVIAGAALDVYQNEPHVNPRFRLLDNLVLTPHIGSATYQARRRMAELMLDNLNHFFKDGSVLTPVLSA